MVWIVLLLALASCGLGSHAAVDFYSINRIVDGILIDIKSRPFQLVLKKRGYFGCGAVLIHEKVAVTAAHCATGFTPDQLTLAAGVTLLSEIEKEYSVSEFKQHPSYGTSGFHFDILLLFPTESFAVNGVSIKPIALPTMPHVLGAYADVSGWGRNEDGILPDHLKATHVQIVDPDLCGHAEMICAEGYGGITCDGDSGGPLTFGPELIGLVSFGDGKVCTNKEKRTGFTPVFKFVPWIKEVVSTKGIDL